jgi:hypothetical protein
MKSLSVLNWTAKVVFTWMPNTKNNCPQAFVFLIEISVLFDPSFKVKKNLVLKDGGGGDQKKTQPMFRNLNNPKDIKKENTVSKLLCRKNFARVARILLFQIFLVTNQLLHIVMNIRLICDHYQYLLQNFKHVVK